MSSPASFPPLRNEDLAQRVLGEFLRRRRKGETISQATLVAEHPDLSDDLEDSFRALAAIEQSHGDALATKTWPPSSTNATSDFIASIADASSETTLLGTSGQRGRFYVQDCLGAGAFGVVYLAHDTLLDRRVALKVPKKARFPTPEHLAQFVAEARLAAQLNHPNIIAVYDVFEERDVVFMVMEYVEGQSLRSLMRGVPMNPIDAARLMEQIADAVAYANQRGLVHRDLKPSNVLIDKEGVPHVTDFGLAVHEETQRLADRQSAGTPGYMAPEQVRGQNNLLDGRTDLWSLGVILYEMLTGRRPFVGVDQEEIFYRILHQEPKPLRQIRPETPPELEAICLRCLAKPIGQRYSTVADLARDLRRWRKGQSGDVVKTSRATVRPNRRVLAVVAIAFFALALGTSIWWFLANQRTTESPQFQTLASVHGGHHRPLDPQNGHVIDLRNANPLEIRPGRWRSLFVRPPTPVSWAHADSRNRFFSNPNEEHVHAVCVGEGLLSLGRVDSGAYEFKVDIQQARWEGGAGIFFGRHEEHDPQLGHNVIRFQRLDVRQILKHGKLDAYAIVRRIVTEWRDGLRQREIPFELTSSEVVVHDLRPHQLHIIIQDNQLVQVRWAGQPLPDLIADPHGMIASQVRPADHYGEFGLMVSSCSADFYQAQAFVRPKKTAADK